MLQKYLSKVLVCAHDLAEEQGRVDTVQETIRHFGGTIGRLYFILSVFSFIVWYDKSCKCCRLQRRCFAPFENEPTNELDPLSMICIIIFKKCDIGFFNRFL